MEREDLDALDHSERGSEIGDRLHFFGDVGQSGNVEFWRRGDFLPDETRADQTGYADAEDCQSKPGGDLIDRDPAEIEFVDLGAQFVAAGAVDLAEPLATVERLANLDRERGQLAADL